MKSLIAYLAIVLATGFLTSHEVSSDPNATKPLWAFDLKSGADSLTSVAPAERLTLLDSLSWRYFGVDGYVYTSGGDDRAAIYRFFSPSNSDHLITTSESERQALKSNPLWHEEAGGDPIGFVSTVNQPGWREMYRVRCPANTNHISTADPHRRQSLLNQGCFLEGLQGYVKSSVYPNGTPPCTAAIWDGSTQGWNDNGTFYPSGISSIDQNKKTVMVVGASVDARLAESMRKSNISGTTHNIVLAWCPGSNGFIDIAAWMLPAVQRMDNIDKVLVGLSAEVLCPSPNWTKKKVNVNRVLKLFHNHGLALPTVSGYMTNFGPLPTTFNLGLITCPGQGQGYYSNATDYLSTFGGNTVQPWTGVYNTISDGLHADVPTADAAANVLKSIWMP